MARKHTVQRPSLASLVFLAGAASANSLSLSNFQSLTSSVSVQCLYAYNLPIRGCSPSDFGSGATCSEGCITGLQAVQFSVQGFCTNINAASNSLLAEVKGGHILDALCKKDAPLKSTASTPTPPPTKTPPPPQTSSQSKETTSTTSTISTTSITSQPISTTSSVPSTTVTTAVTSAIPTTLTSVTIPSSTSESTTETTNAATSQTTNDQQPTSTSEENLKPTRRPNTQPGSGGGSPFDFVASSKATEFGLTRACITMAIAITFTTLTLI
ncbi:hypothetical protein CI102_224 [Trichoderma harzianum]|uniref:Extracellular membrane protein CFEM domain-containing protein n=1 Tax=Trichoderma harzianum CBS 226.95 TaxID=983964 RepID=A0A2T3ZWK4_TRIHA|nr:hypothetical protein M431DRAFT_513158 [Trichoderma harzianum CBS 226.95]PKK54918.1 hypothetical protein CI102_224 [Trichoderma harzianum]PTB49113.1 hypothetical protein M431DRAFT_513158 [Trichoderma harzianum CBS 226.95]